jgi:hypothetical protein
VEIKTVLDFKVCSFTMRIEAVNNTKKVMTTYQTATVWQNKDTPNMNHHHNENCLFREDLALNLDSNTACFVLPETLQVDVGIVPRLNHDCFLPRPFHFITH